MIPTSASHRKALSLPVALIVYTILFFGLWAAFEILGKPWLTTVTEDDIAGQIIKTVIIRNLVWTLPALLLLRRYERRMHIPLREMFTAKVNWLRWLPILTFLALCGPGGDLVNGEKIALSEAFGADDIIIVLFVGITEESVFRGWLLNATADRWGRWPALMVNALMFLAIHFPRWIMDGIFVSVFTGFDFVSVIALSLLFGWSFLRTRNLVLPIALHMIYDLSVMMFI